MTSEKTQTLFSRGLAHHQNGEIHQAMTIYKAVIILDPGHFDSMHLYGVISAQQSHRHLATLFIHRALRVQPNSASANQNLGNILAEGGDRVTAIHLYKRALALNPLHIDACFNLAHSFLALAQINQAQAIAEWSLKLLPNNIHTLKLSIKALAESGSILEALEACDQALRIEPVLIDVRLDKANLLQQSGNFTRALEELSYILAVNPGQGNVYINQSKCFLSLNDLALAEKASRRAIHAHPEMPEAIINLGGVFQIRQEAEKAIALYKTSVVLDPNHGEGLRHLGVVLGEQHLYDKSIGVFKWAIQAHPKLEYVADNLLSDLARTLNWEEFVQIRNYLQSHPDVRALPLNCLWVFDDPEILLQRTKNFALSIGKPQRQSPHSKSSQQKKERIRLGYFSSDFKHHPVAQNLLPLLKHHNRERFEIVGFDFTPSHDDLSGEIITNLDSHHYVIDYTNEALAELSRELEIDIAVDLNGYTRYSRTRVFLNQVAPIVINYLGYPGTMGTDVHDYIVADNHVIPEEFGRYYTESILRLPSFFMPYEFKNFETSSASSRADYNLPKESFVYASFCNLTKLTPEQFRSWLKILKETQNTCLWIAIHGAEKSADRMLKEAARFGIDPQRIIFAARTPTLDAHVDRLRLADLMLDTYPYNGHTTACDAIQAGLPILTRSGRTFASRVVSSLLSTLQIAELITTDQDAYIQRAIELSKDRSRMIAIRNKIGHAKSSGLLLDPLSYTQNFESLLEQALAQKLS